MTQPRVLLHTCCGPCATVCVERLLPAYQVALLWYNPNLYPPEEHDRRLVAARQVAAHFRVEIIEIPPDLSAWLQVVSQTAAWQDQPEGGARCRLCIAMRLARAAKEAAVRGFPYFASSLGLSPHKNADFIVKTALAAAQDHPPVQPLAVDFRKQGGFARSVELSKRLGLYRQNYCGCRYSRCTG